MTSLFDKTITSTGQVRELLAYLIETIPSLTILASLMTGSGFPMTTIPRSPKTW